mmetsp:Transcript_28790/g.51669  ORF Transcript_28790/g.51669 Transcript_28790/m.51669 type:complete len:424 (+) Transcript_28790:862-2133(+)
MSAASWVASTSTTGACTSAPAAFVGLPLPAGAAAAAAEILVVGAAAAAAVLAVGAVGAAGEVLAAGAAVAAAAAPVVLLASLASSAVCFFFPLPLLGRGAAVSVAVGWGGPALRAVMRCSMTCTNMPRGSARCVFASSHVCSFPQALPYSSRAWAGAARSARIAARNPLPTAASSATRWRLWTSPTARVALSGAKGSAIFRRAWAASASSSAAGGLALGLAAGWAPGLGVAGWAAAPLLALAPGGRAASPTPGAVGLASGKAAGLGLTGLGPAATAGSATLVTSAVTTDTAGLAAVLTLAAPIGSWTAGPPALVVQVPVGGWPRSRSCCSRPASLQRSSFLLARSSSSSEVRKSTCRVSCCLPARSSSSSTRRATTSRASCSFASSASLRRCCRSRRAVSDSRSWSSSSTADGIWHCCPDSCT